MPEKKKTSTLNSAKKTGAKTTTRAAKPSTKKVSDTKIAKTSKPMSKKQLTNDSRVTPEKEILTTVKRNDSSNNSPCCGDKKLLWRIVLGKILFLGMVVGMIVILCMLFQLKKTVRENNLSNRELLQRNIITAGGEQNYQAMKAISQDPRYTQLMELQIQQMIDALNFEMPFEE